MSTSAAQVRESRARRKIRQAVEARGYQLVELTWEPWGQAAEKEGIPGGWAGYVSPPPHVSEPHIMGLSWQEAVEWIEQFIPAMATA